MTPRKKPKDDSSQTPIDIEAGELRRLTTLAALLLVKGESQTEKIRMLAAVGYSPSEIAVLVGTTANAVSIALHRIRKKKS